jgi:putative membrane protein
MRHLFLSNEMPFLMGNRHAGHFDSVADHNSRYCGHCLFAGWDPGQRFFFSCFCCRHAGYPQRFFRPIALLLTLPINILSLGLFTFVINALMLKMASGVIPGFNVYGFWTAIFGSFLISVISWLLNAFISEKGSLTAIKPRKSTDARTGEQEDTIDLEHKGDNRWE